MPPPPTWGNLSPPDGTVVTFPSIPRQHPTERNSVRKLDGASLHVCTTSSPSNDTKLFRMVYWNNHEVVTLGATISKKTVRADFKVLSEDYLGAGISRSIFSSLPLILLLSFFHRVFVFPLALTLYFGDYRIESDTR